MCEVNLMKQLNLHMFVGKTREFEFANDNLDIYDILFTFHEQDNDFNID